MYRNKNACCDCNRFNPVDAIEKGICKLKEGVKGIQCGLENICCRCKIREGIKDIQDGLCDVEKGLCEVIEGLKDLEFECDCTCNKDLREAICDVKDAVMGVQEGLNCLKNCCLCDGIECVREALKDLEKGVCDLVEAVNDVLEAREKRRKHRGCGGKYCGNVTDDFCIESDTYNNPGCYRSDY